MPNHADITLIGHLGRDVKIRQAGNYTVGETSIAIKPDYKNKEKTDWYSLTFWGKKAETASQYLTKGMAVMVKGTPTIDSYEKDGETRTVVKVNVNEFVMLGEPKQKQHQTQQNELNDDIPF